ncbi:hypothetical protein KXD40_008433 [Peronospora effusa]|nr:hypothetical protein KXD40_008433 [Peronospora effusa]
MSTTLRTVYTTEEELTKVLNAGMKIPATKDIASKLQEIQPPKQDNGIEKFDFHSFGFKAFVPKHLVELLRSEKVTRMSSNTFKAEFSDAEVAKMDKVAINKSTSRELVHNL